MHLINVRRNEEYEEEKEHEEWKNVSKIGNDDADIQRFYENKVILIRETQDQIKNDQSVKFRNAW